MTLCMFIILSFWKYVCWCFLLFSSMVIHKFPQPQSSYLLNGGNDLNYCLSSLRSVFFLCIMESCYGIGIENKYANFTCCVNKTFGETLISSLKEPFLLLKVKIDWMSLTMTPSFSFTTYHCFPLPCSYLRNKELLEEEGLYIWLHKVYTFYIQSWFDLP